MLARTGGERIERLDDRQLYRQTDRRQIIDRCQIGNRTLLVRYTGRFKYIMGTGLAGYVNFPCKTETREGIGIIQM